MPDINLAPTNFELEAIQKRRKMAELLMQQAQQPTEMPQMAGVRLSPISGLAKLLQTYTANEKLKKADTEEKQYQSDYLSDLGFLMRNAGKSTPATEAIPEQGGNPAVPAMPASPLLSPDLLSGNNANNYLKTGQGKIALAQLLMQQKAQEQTRAEAELAASRQLHAFNPEQNVGTFSGGKFNTVIQGQPKPMTDAQRLDAELKQFAAEIEADKAIDMGRPPRTFERLPKGVPIGAKKIGKDKETGKDVYKLNNDLFVGD